jgi:predicted Zn-dependent protease
LPFKSSRTPRACLCAIILLIILGPFAVGCSISENQELELGRKSHAQFEKQFGGLYPDSRVQQYVNSVGQTVAHYAGRPNLDWQFAVVNSDTPNAFAVPGGYIYITRGLLFRLNNEAELAGVLGHESGHIALRHSVKQIERAQTAQGLSAVAGIVGAFFGIGGVGDVTQIVASLTLMKYSRDQEKQADLSGLKYVTEAGYNPRGMVEVMQVLQTAGGGSKKSPDFLSTHPNPGNRIEYLSSAIDKDYSQAAQTGTMGEENFRAVIGTRPSIGSLEPSRDPPAVARASP